MLTHSVCSQYCTYMRRRAKGSRLVWCAVRRRYRGWNLNWTCTDGPWDGDGQRLFSLRTHNTHSLHAGPRSYSPVRIQPSRKTRGHLNFYKDCGLLASFKFVGEGLKWKVGNAFDWSLGRWSAKQPVSQMNIFGSVGQKTSNFRRQFGELWWAASLWRNILIRKIVPAQEETLVSFLSVDDRWI